MSLSIAFPKMLFVTWVAVLVACTSNGGLLLLNGVDLVTLAKVAESQIETGKVREGILSAELDEGAQTQVAIAVEQYRVAQANLASITKDPITILNAADVIRVEHVRLLGAYEILQGVVADNWDRYSPVDQIRLATWQQEVFRLEVAYQQFIAQLESKNAQDVKSAAVVDLLTTLTKLALAVA